MIERGVKRRAQRDAKKQAKLAKTAAAKEAVSKAAGELQKDLAMTKERLNNLEAWALETMRGNKERENLVQMMATCVTLLIKDCIGRGLSEEETAALTEALDGPPKKGETDGDAPQDTAGEPVPTPSV